MQYEFYTWILFFLLRLRIWTHAFCKQLIDKVCDVRDGDISFSLRFAAIVKWISFFCVIFKLSILYKRIWLTVKNQRAFQNTILFFVSFIVYLNFTKYSPVNCFLNKYRQTWKYEWENASKKACAEVFYYFPRKALSKNFLKKAPSKNLFSSENNNVIFWFVFRLHQLIILR